MRGFGKATGVLTLWAHARRCVAPGPHTCASPEATDRGRRCPTATAIRTPHTTTQDVSCHRHCRRHQRGAKHDRAGGPPSLLADPGKRDVWCTACGTWLPPLRLRPSLDIFARDQDDYDCLNRTIVCTDETSPKSRAARNTDPPMMCAAVLGAAAASVSLMAMSAGSSGHRRLRAAPALNAEEAGPWVVELHNKFVVRLPACRKQGKQHMRPLEHRSGRSLSLRVPGLRVPAQHLPHRRSASTPLPIVVPLCSAGACAHLR